MRTAKVYDTTIVLAKGSITACMDIEDALRSVGVSCWRSDDRQLRVVPQTAGMTRENMMRRAILALARANVRVTR